MIHRNSRNLPLTSHNMKYNNILDKFECEGSRAKVKVTVAILENSFHCSINFWSVINVSVTAFFFSVFKFYSTFNMYISK